LGPLLFLLYINDIVDIFDNRVQVKLFADDMKIYVVVGDIQDRLVLQSGLNRLVEWADLWQLKISISKCAYLHIGVLRSKHDYYVDGNVLESKDEILDLGVMIDSNLKFTLIVMQIPLLEKLTRERHLNLYCVVLFVVMQIYYVERL